MENPLEFSKRSRKAILIFVVFFLILVLIPRLILTLSEPGKFTFSQSEFQKRTYSRYEFKKYEKKQKFVKKSRFQKPPAKFDPNEYAPSDWMYLGLSEKQANVVIKFGKRKFYSNDELKQVFVISTDLFDLIKDSTFYPERPQAYQAENYTPKEYRKKIIELNTASGEDLMKLNGIGAYFAKNILVLRDKLGGFVSKDQLLEVWKMDEEKLKLIDEFISVDPSLINQININTATVEEFKKHPYFSWNVANSIVKLRTQVGGYKQLEDLKKSVLIDDELFDKLKPYLTI